MMNNMDQDDGFCIKVYSPGNFIAKEITINGGVHLGTNTESGGFSDEQIAKALAACVGKGKVIDLKQKWAGAYWYLRWACNYPVDVQKFCEKVKSLPYEKPLGIVCDYNNIRRFCICSFMDYDARDTEKVKVSSMDQDVFSWCREIALKLAEELGKTYLPKV
jgi:hypothetical protein